MSTVSVLFLVSILWMRLHLTYHQQYDLPLSPCPHLFQYKYIDNNWIGELELPSPPIQHHEVVLHITLSLKAATTPDNVGTITIVGTPQEATKKILNREPLMFHVSFPFRHPIPKLVRIVYDGNLLCTGSEEQLSSQTVVSRIELKHVMNTYTNFQPTTINHNNNNLYNFDHNFNKPNDFGSQYTPSKPAYETNYYTPMNSFGMGVPMNMFPVSSSSYPNNGITPMLPPPFPVTQRPAETPSPPPPPLPSITTERSTVKPSFPVSNQELHTICGTRHSETEITPFVFGGEETQRGDWPWMAAIYLNKPTGLSFNCGGTLISSKTVITAAHCINTSTKNFRAHEVVLYLGRYSLIDWSEVGSVATNVEEIIIHTDYKKQRDSFDADIAILIMTKRVEFNEFVRPACLWPDKSSIQEIEGKKGVVVGWGKDGTDRVVSNIPKKVNLPIVNSITCVQTSESLSKAVSNRTFCAGTLDGDGPCHGDSGGGLTLYHNDKWTLRGIVSAGLSDANTGACKLMDYVVFTDVSYFTSWIITHIEF